MTNVNKLFCSALKCQFEKRKHICSDRFILHEKSELSDCPQPNVSKGPLEITGVVHVRAIQAASGRLNPQLSFMVMSILFTMFNASYKTMEVLRD